MVAEITGLSLADFDGDETVVMAARRLGPIIRRRRAKLGMSQGELAVASGMSQASLSQIELRPRFPHIPTLVQIATALGCRVSDLLLEAGL